MSVQDSPGGVMIQPVLGFNLPHLLWFLFGCSVLWMVGRLKADPVAEQVRTIIDGPGEIRRISRTYTRDVVLTEEGMEVDPGGTVGISPSGRGVVFEIPGEDGGRFVAVASFMKRLNSHDQSTKISLRFSNRDGRAKIYRNNRNY
nr:hypothetical protein [uncultured Methanospirillum sp.]